MLPFHTVILGSGRSGIAAAELARAQGVRSLIVLDSGSPKNASELEAQLSTQGIRFFSGENALVQASKLASETELVITSPGIDASWELPSLFTSKGVPLIGETEYAFRHGAPPVVAITGTNGKTTTTELICTILSYAGQRSIPCGNYGTPLSEVGMQNQVNQEAVVIAALETSSFQLETIESFQPEISVWLNFAPDHLDRYPSIEPYYAAKLRIFENQTPDQWAVINAMEPVPTGSARVITFSSAPDLFPADWEFSQGWISYHGTPVLEFAKTKLRGLHNAENLMAALAVGHLRGLDFETMFQAIRLYTPPAHRCEWIATCNDVDYLNDSKATNLHALHSSLRGAERPVVLIAGGKQKGLDYRPLHDLIKRKVAAAVVIGEIADSLEEIWSPLIPVTKASTLLEAVQEASKLAQPGQTVLFSPGTSSFDMFRGYEHRGNAFRDAVQVILSLNPTS